MDIIQLCEQTSAILHISLDPMVHKSSINRLLATLDLVVLVPDKVEFVQLSDSAIPAMIESISRRKKNDTSRR